MKFNDFIPIWKDYKKDYIKPQTLTVYMFQIKTHLIDDFGDLELDRIDNDIVNNFAIKKIESGLSKKTINDIIITLKQILKIASLLGYCSIKVIEVRYPKIYDEKNNRNQIEVLNQNEYAKLIDYCKTKLNDKSLGILIVAFTGMRIGEVCALKWQDIDIENGVINVRRTIQRIYDTNLDKTKIQISSTKTENSNRDIPIINDLISILKPLKKLYSNDCYILSNSDNPTEPRVYRSYFNNLLKKLNIKNIKFHGLRHSFASRLVEKGIDIKTISSILGHSKVEITMNLYVHPTKENKKNAISKAFKGL